MFCERIHGPGPAVCVYCACSQGIVQVVKHPAPFSVAVFHVFRKSSLYAAVGLPGIHIILQRLAVGIGDIDIYAHPVYEALHIHLIQKALVNFRVIQILPIKIVPQSPVAFDFFLYTVRHVAGVFDKSGFFRRGVVAAFQIF